jgi:hypothetical protein
MRAVVIALKICYCFKKIKYLDDWYMLGIKIFMIDKYEINLYKKY